MPLQDQANLHTRAAILLSKHKKRCCARTIRCAPSRSAATAHRLAPERKCGTSPPLQLALKEWAVTCAALGGGDQTIVLRKGGIREPTFQPAADTFLLFPTSFHSKTNLLVPGASRKYHKELAFDQKTATHLTLQHVASLTGCWTTFDPNVLSALSQHHVWTDEFLSTRLKLRAKQPITVMELRCSRLQQPLVIPTLDSYWGCFSWVDVEQGLSQEQISTATAVIANDDFAVRQKLVRTALVQLDDCTEMSVN